MKRFLISFFLIFLVLVCGTLGYTLIEQWDIFNSFYMTIITISTVGFHEVSELGLQGRIFTIILIILGIGVGGYTIGNLSAFIIEGHIRNLLKGKKMEKQIAALNNHIIVCGFGRTGSEICSILSSTAKKHIIIEKTDENIQEALNKNYLVVQGDATEDDILKK